MPPTPTITPKIHFLNQPIVSFQKQPVRNPRSTLAVIFIPFFTYIFTKE